MRNPQSTNRGFGTLKNGCAFIYDRLDLQFPDTSFLGIHCSCIHLELPGNQKHGSILYIYIYTSIIHGYVSQQGDPQDECQAVSCWFPFETTPKVVLSKNTHAPYFLCQWLSLGFHADSQECHTPFIASTGRGSELGLQGCIREPQHLKRGWAVLNRQIRRVGKRMLAGCLLNYCVLISQREIPNDLRALGSSRVCDFSAVSEAVVTQGKKWQDGAS